MSCLRSLAIPAIPPILATNSLVAECLGVRNGVPMTNDEIATTWNLGQCQESLYTVIYPTADNFSLAGYRSLQAGMSYMMARYYTPDRVPALPGQDGYTAVQDIIANICSGRDQVGLQGVCDPSLTDMCQDCSRNEVSQTDPLLRLCGCYVPLPDPTVYGDIARQCDAPCDRFQYVATLRDPSDPSKLLRCEGNTVCVVDQVSISASKSQTGGASITQICPGCNSGSGNSSDCRCVIDIDIANQTGLDTEIQYNQYCGAGSVCTRVDSSTGATTQVPCSTLTPAAISYPSDVSTPVWGTAIVITLLILVLYLAVSKR